jgi:hypothetical protein
MVAVACHLSPNKTLCKTAAELFDMKDFANYTCEIRDLGAAAFLEFYDNYVKYRLH